MRLYEFDDSPSDALKSILLTLADSDSVADGPQTYNTASIIAMVQNTGQPFTYSDLVNAATNDPSVKALIANYNQQELTLGSAEINDGGGGSEEHEETGAETVSAMAQRALAKRKK
jgi:hypothetical protein